jgi:hypothetical protein
MTLTVEDVKKLTADFQAAKQELQAKIQRAPDSPDIWDEDHEESSSLAALVRGLNTDTMPPAALAMQEQLIADLEVFGNAINSKISEVSIHNNRIQLEIEKLTKDFLAAIRVPESDLGAALLINKKIIDPVDYEAIVAVYRGLGFTNFEIKAQKDIVYYNPDIKHFNTLKDEIFEAFPKDLRKKYPTFLNFIQNSIVRTNPVYGHGLIQVMEARQV